MKSKVLQRRRRRRRKGHSDGFHRPALRRKRGAREGSESGRLGVGVRRSVLWVDDGGKAHCDLLKSKEASAASVARGAQ